MELERTCRCGAPAVRSVTTRGEYLCADCWRDLDHHPEPTAGVTHLLTPAGLATYCDTDPKELTDAIEVASCEECLAGKLRSLRGSIWACRGTWHDGTAERLTVLATEVVCRLLALDETHEHETCEACGSCHAHARCTLCGVGHPREWECPPEHGSEQPPAEAEVPA